MCFGAVFELGSSILGAAVGCWPRNESGSVWIWHAMLCFCVLLYTYILLYSRVGLAFI